jgi:hypothetical protein
LVTLSIGRQYAEHAGKSVSNSFNTQWTAPASGTGPITFYGAGAAVNQATTDGGQSPLFLRVSADTEMWCVRCWRQAPLWTWPRRNAASRRSTLRAPTTEGRWYVCCWRRAPL